VRSAATIHPHRERQHRSSKLGLPQNHAIDTQRAVNNEGDEANEPGSPVVGARKD
jgi:hypothetical protein